MTALGQHFMDTQKAWGFAAQRSPVPPVPLVDVAWASSPYAGHDINSTLTRLDNACNQLWSDGIRDIRPYLRIDWQPGLTLANPSQYADAVGYAMNWWTSTPRARLRIITGNEPNVPWEGPVAPAQVVACVAAAVQRRDAFGYPVDLYAPAVGPWFYDGTPGHYDGNVPTPDDFYPGPSSPWKNHTYGIARRCFALSLNVRYAIHAYSRNTMSLGTNEPHTDQYGTFGAQYGFRCYRDALNAISTGDPRGASIVLSEVNCHTDAPSSQNYVPGLLQNMLSEVASVPRIQDVCWYVGTADNEEQEYDAMQTRSNHMAQADDDFNHIVLGV